MTLPKPKHDTQSMPSVERLDPDERVDAEHIPPFPSDEQTVAPPEGERDSDRNRTVAPPEGERDSDRNRISWPKKMGVAAVGVVVAGVAALTGKELLGNSSEPQPTTSASSAATESVNPNASTKIEGNPDIIQTSAIDLNYRATPEMIAEAKQPLMYADYADNLPAAVIDLGSKINVLNNSGDCGECEDYPYQESPEVAKGTMEQIYAIFTVNATTGRDDFVEGFTESRRRLAWERYSVEYYGRGYGKEDPVLSNVSLYPNASTLRQIDDTTFTIDAEAVATTNCEEIDCTSKIINSTHPWTITLQVQADGRLLIDKNVVTG